MLQSLFLCMEQYKYKVYGYTPMILFPFSKKKKKKNDGTEFALILYANLSTNYERKELAVSEPLKVFPHT